MRGGWACPERSRRVVGWLGCWVKDRTTTSRRPDSIQEIRDFMKVKVLLYIFLTMFVVSCSISGKANKSSYFPPSTFTDADLVGSWEVVYGGTYNDSIMFRSDGTFQQVFTTNYGY